MASAKTTKVTDALAKKVLAKRRQGWSWNEIMDAGICTVGQITPIRARMRKLDKASVQNSGPKFAAKKVRRSRKAA